MLSATHSRTWRKLPSVTVVAIALVAVLTLPESVAAQDTCSSGLAVANPDDDPGLVSDCEALLSARDNLARTGSLNWSASQRINDWDGITVSGSPRRVTKISLVDAGLTGAIPRRIWQPGPTDLAGPVGERNIGTHTRRVGQPFQASISEPVR